MLFVLAFYFLTISLGVYDLWWLHSIPIYQIRGRMFLECLLRGIGYIFEPIERAVLFFTTPESVALL